MNNINDTLLLTPGPTKIPLSVQERSGRAVMHHRTSEFSQILYELLHGLKPIFGTNQSVLPVHSTGRGAMEATITNLFQPDDHILAICNGKFGEMFGDIAERYQCRVSRIFTDWYQEIHIESIRQFINDNPDLKAITVVHSDTSSGVLNPVDLIAELTRNTEILLIVDGISSIGNVKFEFDHWGVDVAITASQKGLMSFPGLSFVVLSEKAWDFEKRATLPRYYTNFKDIHKLTTKDVPETPGTTPVSLVVACHEAVRLLHAEGLDNVYRRFNTISENLRKIMLELGYTPFPGNFQQYSPTVSLYHVPEGLSANDVTNYLLNYHKIYIQKALDHNKDKVIRIGHMGDVREADIDRLLKALMEGVR